MIHPLGIPGWWEGIGPDTFELFYFIVGVIRRGTSGPFHRYLFPQNAGGGGRGLHLLSSGEWLSIAG